MDGTLYKENSPQTDLFKYELREYAKKKKMEFNEQSTDDLWVFQMRKPSMTAGIGSKALSIVIENIDDNTVKVCIGNSKWGAKIASTALITFLFAPLVIIPAIGAAKQGLLIADIKKMIKKRFQEI